jgi:RNA polymerase sigma-70 factor (ECF subfamily)
MHASHEDITKRFMDAYDLLSDAIFRHCYYRVYEREKALELTQETFARTWEYMAAGKEVENLKAFIYRVANNLIIDSSRRKTSLSLEVLMEDGFMPKAEMSAGVMTDAPTHAETSLMLAKLGELDDAHRDAVSMRFLDGLSPKEIAEITGESENAVSVRIHRGVKKLRDAIA